jgi:hypothetical protein
MILYLIICFSSFGSSMFPLLCRASSFGMMIAFFGMSIAPIFSYLLLSSGSMFVCGIVLFVVGLNGSLSSK